MKKILAVAAVASLAGLAGCSVATPAPAATTSAAAPTTSSPVRPQPTPSRSSDAPAPQAGGVRAACEQFNKLYADYKAIQGDANAYEKIYFAAQDAKDAASGNQKGLFASLSVLSLERSSAGSGGEVDQSSKDLVRDAVFANAQECTAEGVTLRL